MSALAGCKQPRTFCANRGFSIFFFCNIFFGCFFFSIYSKSIQFSMFSASEIGKVAEVQVYRGVYYDQERKPMVGGLLDPRMVLAPSLFVLSTISPSFCVLLCDFDDSMSSHRVEY